MSVLVHAGDVSVGGSNTELQNNNEVYLNIKNTEASGRQYALVSAGSSGGIGVGKFSIYDKTAAVSRLTVDANGNVGVGTTSPDQLLQVQGNIALGRRAQSAVTRFIGFQNSDDNFYTGDTSGTTGMILDQLSSGDTDIYFKTGAWGSQESRKMVIKGSGNVGIGTTNPSAKLDVNGKGHFSGGVDPPYVSFSEESHQSIRNYAKDVQEHEKVMQFWNGKAHRMEIYVIGEDKFYTTTGILVSE